MSPNYRTHYEFYKEEISEWKCELISGTFFRPKKGKEPNWFWRKMQYLAFGFKWTKTNDVL